jgi:hypothetical protein
MNTQLYPFYIIILDNYDTTLKHTRYCIYCNTGFFSVEMLKGTILQDEYERDTIP